MITAAIFDHGARLRSYEIVAESVPMGGASGPAQGAGGRP
jgi:hypothetical protein